MVVQACGVNQRQETEEFEASLSCINTVCPKKKGLKKEETEKRNNNNKQLKSNNNTSTQNDIHFLSWSKLITPKLGLSGLGTHEHFLKIYSNGIQNLFYMLL